ncbi:MAG: hypothetical protein GX825_06245, partial [Syntrophomonadaceae bacterium]|nr:hypothetical protein [Syntrophomonadaceae bacterium]
QLTPSIAGYYGLAVTITFVRKVKGVYLCQGSKDKGEKKYVEFNKLYRKIYNLSKHKKLLVQQGITSPSRTGKFDVRVMVQKESDNSWQITGLAGRIGAKGRITTNLHTGGQSAHLEQLLSRCGFAHEKVVDIIATIKELALNIANSIEKHVKPIGEIGMDFIIDEYGGIWFLEVNSKPGRRAFSSIESNGENRMTIIRPMRYAQYLAGF